MSFFIGISIEYLKIGRIVIINLKIIYIHIHIHEQKQVIMYLRNVYKIYLS